MKRLFALLVFLLIVPASIWAQGPEEQYIRVYQLIQEADRLNESGQGRAAAVKYVEAQEALMRFRGIYPGWNERVVNYRLNYVATKLARLSSTLTGTGVPILTNTNAVAVQTTNTITAPPVTTAHAMSSGCRWTTVCWARS